MYENLTRFISLLPDAEAEQDGGTDRGVGEVAPQNVQDVYDNRYQMEMDVQ